MIQSECQATSHDEHFMFLELLALSPKSVPKAPSVNSPYPTGLFISLNALYVQFSTECFEILDNHGIPGGN